MAAILNSGGWANAPPLPPCDSDDNNAYEYLVNGLRLDLAIVEPETGVPVVLQHPED
jgi:hypothetical protein